MQYLVENVITAKREMYTHCENLQSVGHSLPGGFAQFLKVKDNTVFKVPDQLSFNEACTDGTGGMRNSLYGSTGY